jgi:hypothetical protein
MAEGRDLARLARPIDQREAASSDKGFVSIRRIAGQPVYNGILHDLCCKPARLAFEWAVACGIKARKA